MADHLAVLNMPVEALKRSHTTTSFEPLTLLSALSQVTSKIGLAATASTTYDEAYHIARRFASLDHLSKGRAAWNIVTTSNPESAKNFGQDEHMAHSNRYRRAREFYDVVTGLWDSFADDAFVRDVDSGTYLDPSKMHVLNHHGPELRVRGPLNIARPPQGWPVIIQAGQSEPGRQLAAETAEAVFCSPKDLATAQSLYADIKTRAESYGRDRNHIKILPAAIIFLGESRADAQEKRLTLDSHVHYDSALASLSISLGCDASTFDPDAPLPTTTLPPTNASHTAREGVLQLAAQEGLTVRQLAQRYGGYSGLAFVGTPAQVADEMCMWLDAEACDGFTCALPFLPQGLDDVVAKLVPELQSRGRFRKEYEGDTLRDHLGLPRPGNRFFVGGGPAAAAAATNGNGAEHDEAQASYPNGARQIPPVALQVPTTIQQPKEEEAAADNHWSAAEMEAILEGSR